MLFAASAPDASHIGSPIPGTVGLFSKN